MSDLRSFLEKEMNHLESRIAFLKNSIAALPPENVSCSISHGKEIWRMTKNGTRITIPTREVSQAATPRALRMLYEAQLSDAEKSLASLLTAVRVYEKSPSKTELFRRKPEPFHKLISDSYDYGDQFLNKWVHSPHEHNPLYPEQLKIRTVRGELVRSKSESMIADRYFYYRLAYIYDSVFRMGQYTFYPDFQIMLPGTHQIIIHEHLGLLHDPKYRAEALRKLDIYISNGFYPNINLLLTTESPDHPFSLSDVDSLYVNYIEPLYRYS